MPGFVSLLLLFAAMLAPRLLLAQAGGLDARFNAGALLNGTAPGTVSAFKLLASGKTVVGGEFSSINGTARGNLGAFLIEWRGWNRETRRDC